MHHYKFFCQWINCLCTVLVGNQPYHLLRKTVLLCNLLFRIVYKNQRIACMVLVAVLNQCCHLQQFSRDGYMNRLLTHCKPLTILKRNKIKQNNDVQHFLSLNCKLCLWFARLFQYMLLEKGFVFSIVTLLSHEAHLYP